MKKALAFGMTLLFVAMLAMGCGRASAPVEQSQAAAREPAAIPAPVATAPPAATLESPQPVTMLLAAAASLENSFVTTLIPMFTAQYSWITIEGTYDSSGKLQNQIEEGLEASVFMSAANKQMNALKDGGLIDPATVVELVENEIVLIAPIDLDTSIDSFEKIVEAKAVAIGDPASVPAGQYAEEALTSLGIWDAAQKKASLGTNVMEVLNAVAEASADVGIVYATDAAQMPTKVKVLASAPEGSLATKVIYPVGILTNAPEREAAELFAAFLQSPEAMEVFLANGFKSNIL